MSNKTMAFKMTGGLVFALLLTACGNDENQAAVEPPVVRGLRSVVVRDLERSTVRRYPSVLQPSSISTLSFEIAGNLSEVKLDVGQIVKKGEVLARIDSTTLVLQVESAEAALRQAKSSSQTATEDLERKTILLKQGVVTRAVADQARNAAASAREILIQTKKQLAAAQKNLTKAELKAPFDGIINTVEVSSFTNVSPGAVIATLYGMDSFEASFSVNYTVINQLVVGKQAIVRLADDPAIRLKAHISELGARAGTVSSFPVVVKIDSANPGLKAGIAVEVSLRFTLKQGKGYVLPLTVLALEGKIKQTGKDSKLAQAFVYVYDKATSRVKRRAVTIAGVRENSLIITGGLKPGERVASAGVSFLRDGQLVKLLPDADRE